MKMMMEDLTLGLEKLIELCETIDKNASEMETFRNIPLAKEALELIKEMPDYYEDELSPYIKASLLEEIVSRTDELWHPRLTLEIRRYQLEKLSYLTEEDYKNIDDDYPVKAEDVAYEISRLEDYINPEISMEEFCRKYNKMLKFDEVERSSRWEEVIYEAQKAAYEEVGKNFGMGYCFGFWSALSSELAKRGVIWKSPSAMNPRVHFD